MVEYDKKVIVEYAQHLYKKANSIITLYTFIGILAGILIGIIFGCSGHGDILLLCILIAGGLGFVIGKEVAFKLKLEAQIALCQIKIEENTRK